MKIAIISDLHLGFASRSEREKDAFVQAKQAVEQALVEQPDFILVLGDIFDEDVPSPEALHDCFEIFSLAKKQKPSIEAEIIERNGANKRLFLSSVPIFAIHGTHEYRGKDHKNALEVCNAAGLLYYLHAAKVFVKKGSETVVVHGLGGIPEKFALSALQAWNPKPAHGAFNIIVLHQSIKEFLPTTDEMSATISLDDLPQGFQLIINGHLHWSNEKQLRNSLLLMPGSTVVTQMKNLESTKPKGFMLFDTVTGKAEFREIAVQRKLVYEKLKLENASVETVRTAVKEKLSEIALQHFDSKPMVRLKLHGSLAKGVASADLDLAKIESEFKDKMILSLDHDFSVVSLKKKIEELRALQKTKASISSMGLELLEKNLAETNFDNAFDVRRVFALLAENDAEKVLELLSNNEKKE